MDRHAGSSEHLRDVGVRAEEIIEDRANLRPCLHTQNGFKVRRINLDVSGVLRVEDGAIEHGGLVVAAVIVLQLRLYLALLQLLFKEARELRQLGVVGQLRYIDVREVKLVGDHQRLLLVHAGLGRDGAHKEVLGVNGSGGTRLRTLATLTRLTAGG